MRDIEFISSFLAVLFLIFAHDAFIFARNIFMRCSFSFSFFLSISSAVFLFCFSFLLLAFDYGTQKIYSF